MRNKAKYAAYMREWNRKHPGYAATLHKRKRALHPEKCWDANLKYSFGIGLVDYVDMVLSQGYKCLICKEEPRKRLHVDHDHKTGKVRGLLCHGCNTSLHKMERNLSWGDAARAYLEKYS